MTNDKTNNPFSEIEPAVWAVVSEPIDSAAVERVKAKAKQISETETSKVESKPPLTRKTGSRVANWIIRGALAAMIVLAVGILMFMPGGQQSSLAAALKKLDAVKAFSFDKHIYSKNGVTPVHMHVTVAADRRQRNETDSNITIFDESGSLRLSLHPNTKLAVPIEAQNVPSGFSQLDWFEKLKSYGKSPSKELGEKIVGGKTIFGGEVLIGSSRFHIWIEKESQELFEIEHFVNDAKLNINKTVINNFDFREEVDESIFSYEVPEGYNVQRITDSLKAIVANPEKNMVEALRLFTKLSNGKFPNALNQWIEWIKLQSNADPATKKELQERLGGINSFCSGLSMKPNQSDYLGRGMMLNQPERKIVFWYKTKEGSIRAIYTDLTVAEVAESDLPAKSKSE
jgi:outer membrane lipoprotein-sorting protein